MENKKENTNERDIRIIIATAIIAMAFVLGFASGKGVAIKDARLVEENASSYVLSFGESEHLYLRDDVITMHLESKR